MRFVTVRELRASSAEIWRRLSDEGELVVTSNGKPVAILSATSEDRLEQSLAHLRRARALAAVERMQRESLGRSAIGSDEVIREIEAARSERGT